MGRVLTAVLALHWMAAFARASIHAIGSVVGIGSGERIAAFQLSSGWEAIGHAGLATSSAIVAALFLWLMVSALAGNSAGSSTEDLARLAFGAGIAVATLSLVTGLQGIYGNHVATSAVPLIGLLCSYLVVRADRPAPRQAVAAIIPDMRGNARLMASRAAQQTILPLLGNVPVPANDRGQR